MIRFDKTQPRPTSARLLLFAGAAPAVTTPLRLTLFWIVACAIAFVAAMRFLPAAFVDGHYIPVSNDSFYHARRILDEVAQPGSFYEFDPRIHYPEGSWIPWPWGFDYLVAHIVRAVLWLGGPHDAMAVLAYVPVFAIPITLALVLAVTGALKLSLPMRAIAMLCFALSPTTQGLHAVGVIGHHFAEHIFTLASALFAILWLRSPGSVSRWSIALGATLGAAVAIHNGLFILQLPVLAALGLAFLRGERLDRKATLGFSVALFVTTLLAAFPSQALRNGSFAFYLLSWFHVYIAACTAVVAVLLSRWPSDRRHWVMLGVLALVLLVPVAAQTVVGASFISGQMDVLRGVDEVRSPLQLALSATGAERITRWYGLFVWIVPLLIGLSVVQVYRERRPGFSYFWIFAAMSLVMLLFQLRFFYFGTLALFVAPLWAVDRLRVLYPERDRLIVLLGCLVALGFIAPATKTSFTDKPPPALDIDYAYTRWIYPPLASACKAAPGLVLADANQGHYVRYHTDCPVMADNFRMTPQDAEQIAKVGHLYSLTPEQLLAEGPQIRYVIAMLNDVIEQRPDGTVVATPVDTLRRANAQLNVDLLMTDVSTLPPRFRLLKEIVQTRAATPKARLFEILPPPLS